MDKPRFDRDVRPILARKCFACHGPDEETREADLRLDAKDSASSVIDTENPDESELLQRVFSEDADSVMPPPDSGKQLTASERDTLRRWVQSGASFQQHWAFVPPQKPVVPAASGWARNEIDHFIERRQHRLQLSPSAEADAHTLIRRVSLDLVGLLPDVEQADQIISSNGELTDEAFEASLDELFASQHYGERWARPWLDLARYSDTNGYEKDRPRSIWPYRDWVIEALNDDMPFDQFSIEQLAGDMLPNATPSQRIATGFHRNTMLNEEGGIDPLEYRFYAMVDRVATTGTVWMGLTIGCAQCHSHKYDPISHSDYYRFMALLDNADEPDLEVVDAAREKEKTRLRKRIARLEAELEAKYPAEKDLEDDVTRWIEQTRESLAQWIVAEPTKFTTNLPKLERLADNSLFASGDFTKRDEYKIELQLPSDRPITAIRLEALPDARLPANGPGRAYYEGRKGDFFLSEIEFHTEDGAKIEFASGTRSFGKIAVGSGNAEAANVFDGEGSTGWSTATKEGQRHTLVLNFEKPVTTKALAVRILFERHFVAGLGRFRFSVTHDDEDVKAVGLPESLERLLGKPTKQYTEDDYQQLRQSFLRQCDELTEARKPLEKLRARLQQSTLTMVMQERPPDNRRKTFRHHRGEWLSPREEVVPGVPNVFLPIENAQPNRLALAQWLVSEKNPVVARVVVNRAWRQLMGYGLVRSDGDFGTQADPPTHPGLLDWLATEFMENGWSLKWLHRKIVSSATYRQSSRFTEALKTKDPNNESFARGPRYRTDAETIRDIMLGASGLLSKKIGGESVRPPQPASVTAIAYGNTNWKAAQGEERYRRSLYTFSKRTAPFAAFTTFDGPTGENCVAKRTRSNTPLQALTLLNDEMYLEMARALGKLAAAEQTETNKQIEFMFRQLLIRRPDSKEKERLRSYYDKQVARLRDATLSGERIAETKKANVAALTMVARVLMNLDEVITQH